MALEKITQAQMDEQGVCAAPDILDGTPEENKAIFDRMVRSLIAPAYNAAVDAVNEMEKKQPEWENAENARVANEENRIKEENDRVNAEKNRVDVEQRRAIEEGERETAERTRVETEQTRVKEENNREAAEQERMAAEKERVAAEQERMAAEKERAASEKLRCTWEDYSPDVIYSPGIKVYYLGSSYLNLKKCKDILPSDTEYWKLIAKKGEDGNGSGDMLSNVYDPTGRARDVFEYIDRAKRQLVEANSIDQKNYTVNVPGVTSLYVGLEITILPDAISATGDLTLNVNGLGEYPIVCRGGGASNNITTFKSEGVLYPGYPLTVVFAGGMWICDVPTISESVVEFTADQWAGSDIDGYTLAISKEEHKRTNANFTFDVWDLQPDGAYTKNTWQAMSVDMQYDSATGNFYLLSETAFSGKIIFNG